VHALNQSIDFLIPKYWQNISKLKDSLNNIIHPHIHIKKINFVNTDFHSRFHAIKRSYRYVIINQYNPFNANYTYYKKELNIKKIQKAIKLFEGIHNFEYFSKTGSEVNSFIREIYKTDVISYKNYVIIKFIGNGFLRSQVRMMTQFLIDISDEIYSIEELNLQITKQKKVSTKLISPTGLYLERVFYENFNN
jgi:tRNA pseudouridine38-40 synthase